MRKGFLDLLRDAAVGLTHRYTAGMITAVDPCAGIVIVTNPYGGHAVITHVAYVTLQDGSHRRRWYTAAGVGGLTDVQVIESARALARALAINPDSITAPHGFEPIHAL